MQRNIRPPAGRLSPISQKHFDTSGKSPAQLHHHAIRKMPIALPGSRRFGAMTGQKSRQIEVATARASE
jgi:hypothetical protein